MSGVSRERIVLHVIDRDTGGVPMAARSYVSNAPEGFRQHVLTPYSADRVPDMWKDSGVELHQLPSGHLRRFRYLRRLIRHVRPDVVHAHSSFSGVYSRVSVSRGMAKVVYSPHCFAFERRDISWLERRTYWLIERALRFRTDTLAACSLSEQSIAKTALGYGANVDIVPNISSVADIDAEGRSRGEVLRIAMIGRISEQKDPDYFMKMVASVRGATKVEAVWIGDGNDEGRRLLIEGGVRVTGWLSQTELRSELGSVDLYMHSAAWEGFPIAIIDAHQAGIPVIARRFSEHWQPPSSIIDSEAIPELNRAIADGRFSDWTAANLLSWEALLKENTGAGQKAALERIWS